MRERERDKERVKDRAGQRERQGERERERERDARVDLIILFSHIGLSSIIFLISASSYGGNFPSRLSCHCVFF